MQIIGNFATRELYKICYLSAVPKYHCLPQVVADRFVAQVVSSDEILILSQLLDQD
jgi:hypothetical protein